MNSDSHSDSEIKKFYELKNIAVVGMSKNRRKASSFCAEISYRTRIQCYSVNPAITAEVLGRKSSALYCRYARKDRYC